MYFDRVLGIVAMVGEVSEELQDKNISADNCIQVQSYGGTMKGNRGTSWDQAVYVDKPKETEEKESPCGFRLVQESFLGGGVVIQEGSSS